MASLCPGNWRAQTEKIEMLPLPPGSIQLTIYQVEEETESYQMHVCLPSADDSLGRCSRRARPTLVKIFKVSRIFKWVFPGPGGGFWLYNLAGFVGGRRLNSFVFIMPSSHICALPILRRAQTILIAIISATVWIRLN